MPLDPIAFTDFKPGILDNPGIQYPPTQATRDNTYRCISNKSGALTPLPRKTITLAGTHHNGSNPTPGFYLIVGLFVAGPVLPTSGSASDKPFEIYLGTEYLTGGNRLIKVERERTFLATPSRDVLKSISSADAATDGTGWGMTFGITRSNAATPLSPGIPVVVFAWGSIIDAADSFVSVFPDDTAPTTNAVFDVITGDQDMITCHQGRIVMREQIAYPHGVTAGWNPTEDVSWTAVNDPSDITASGVVFVEEFPDGYAIMAPMSANELFALKASFGVVIRGDLDDPTVINLPMVPGTAIGQSGVHAPMGFLYGNSVSGVWAWQHGDTAQLISAGMAPDFFVVIPIRHAAQQYQWAYSGELIFLSNNFVFESGLGSWWRLDDEDNIQTRYMATDYSRRYIYGSMTTYTNEADTFAWGWDRTLGAISYSWQSHPIFQSIGSTLKITQLELIAKGQGTVTLTLTGIDGSTVTRSIALANNGFPERFRKPISIAGQYIQLRIEADSGDDDVEAATIYSVILHPDSRAPFSTAVG